MVWQGSKNSQQKGLAMSSEYNFFSGCPAYVYALQDHINTEELPHEVPDAAKDLQPVAVIYVNEQGQQCDYLGRTGQ